MDCCINVCSGKHTESFVLDSDNVTANRIADLIRERFEVADGADVPAVTYEDDEGDTINLNLGVAVEFKEALRVMQLGDSQQSLCFKLVESLPLRPAAPAAAAASTKTEPAPQAVYQKQAAQYTVMAAEYEKSVAEHAVAMEEYKKQLKAGTAMLAPAAVDVAATTSSGKAIVEDASGIATTIQALLQNHAADCVQRVEALESDVAFHKAAAADNAAATVNAEHRAHDLEVQLVEQQAAVVAARRESADLIERVSSLTNASQKLSAQLALAQNDKDTAALQHTAEKKDLVDVIGEQREELATKQLEVADLRNEVAGLRTQLEEVFGKIACLLPDANPSPAVQTFSTVAKKLGGFTDKVEAACVAVKEELIEAVHSTNNYAKQKRKEVQYNREEAETGPAPKQGGGGAAAAAAAAVAGTQPSAFVQMMDRNMDNAMTELEVELDASEADTVSDVSACDQEALRKLQNMGFDVEQMRVSELMAANNNDVSAVLEVLLQ